MMNALLRGVVQSALTGYLKDRCNIERPVNSTDQYGIVGGGGWDMVARNVACRLLPMKSGGNGLIAGAEMGKDVFRLIVEVDTDLQHGDRVKFNNQLYEVLSLEDSQSDSVDKRAMVSRTNE